MKSTKDAKGGGDSGVRPTKAIYKTPRLEVYGDVGDITRTVGNKGMADGGGANMDKTGT